MSKATHRNTVAAAAALAACVALAGCSGPLSAFAGPKAGVGEALAAKTAALSPKVTSTISKGVLTVGIDTQDSMVPLYVGSSSGKAYGMDVDLASALADELGLKVRFVSVDDANPGLGTTCDVLMGAVDGQVGATTVVGDYAEQASAFFHKGDTGIAKVDDLSSKSVGVQTGSVSQTALSKTGLMMSVKTYDNLNAAFDALESGGVDYVLCDAYSGAYLSARYEEVCLAGTLDAPKAQGIAVSSQNAELADAVKAAYDAVEKNGLMGLVRRRWVAGMDPLSASSQVQDVPAGSPTAAGETTATDGSSGSANQASLAAAPASHEAGSNAATV
ncbi:ABC transporter substrate-binding protein [Parafannyhessea umbonata]|uniref:substrate-binding periplasmic protein n=1 Tax=Parafannyhessea umbonata TaxID=604330 RepID=UPI0026ECB923|nr:transporter substrate-binding domain-containing protein [Parafannyhessea umbonata]MDD7198678.1 transporter substrate-binding domain-containing protein [Parafannyhessea umbonata]MDY4418138.1 transporter substrate-binding domain-containing protein [Parafannyhessea umbonata]